MILTDIDANKDDILNILFLSDVKLTPQAFIKEIKLKFSISALSAKKILQQLINDQELSYHYLYGSTYIEKSFLRPVCISKHFILKPPGFKTQPDHVGPGQDDIDPYSSGKSKIDQNRIDPKKIELIIEQGISFGSGQHPTTELCLAAIDHCFFDTKMVRCRHDSTGADIGTGSGVLAIAMCLCGLSSCSAYEIDPVSLNEAKKNIRLNHLDKKVKLIGKTMQVSKEPFSIICANLRFPTLTFLSDMIYESLEDNGVVILSGVRVWEKDKLIAIYMEKGFKLVWQQDEKKWSAFVLIKKVC